MLKLDLLLSIGILIIMIIGLIGTVMPAVPGNGLIFIAALVYAVVTKFEVISIGTVIIFLGLTIASFFIDYGASIITTKKVGASKQAIFLGTAMGIAGFFVFGILGFIVGQFLGAFIGELLYRQGVKKSLLVGISTFFGYIIGIVISSTIGLIMIATYVVKVFF